MYLVPFYSFRINDLQQDVCTACYLLLPYMRCDLWSNRTQAIDTLTPGHCQSYPATLYRDSWIPVERSTDGVYTGVSTTTSRMTLSSTSGTKLLRVRSGARLIIQPFLATKYWHLVAKVVRRNILNILWMRIYAWRYQHYGPFRYGWSISITV